MCQKNWKYFHKYLVALTIYLIVTTLFGIALTDLRSYFYKSSTPKIITAAILAYLVSFYGCYDRKKFQRLLIILSSVIAFFVVSYSFFNEKNLEGYSGNFNVIAYPIIQTFLGKTLLVDLKSNYGLHPYFLEPLLHLFGTDVEVIAAIMAALNLISLLAILYCLFAVIGNKILAFLGFCAVIFLQSFAIDIWPTPVSIGYQYEPIRLLFPTLLLAFFCFYFKAPTAKKYYFSLFFFSLAALWNLDTGAPTFLVLVIILGYEKWFFSSREQLTLKSIALHLLQCLGIFITAWGLFFLMIKFRSGSWPDLGLLTYGQRAAFDFGFSMLPMPLFGLWHFVILIYIAGMILAIRDFLDRNHSIQSAFLAISTLLGIGLFTYYLGRSHVSNLFHVGYPAVILLAIFADRFCAKLSRTDFKKLPKLSSDNALRIMPLIVICHLSASLFFGFFDFERLSKDFFLNRKPDDAYWFKDLAFIEKHIGKAESPRDDLLIIEMDHKDYFFTAQLKARSPLNMINVSHLFYVDELKEMYRILASREKEWVILIGPESWEFSRSEAKELKTLLNKNYKLYPKEGVLVSIYRLAD